MMLILDRSDGTIAYISSDSGMLCVDRSLLAEDVCEGDVLLVQGERYVKDEAATDMRRKQIRSLLHDRLKLT